MDEPEFDAAPAGEAVAAVEARWVAPRDRTPPAMDHAPGRKPSAYTPEMGALILARIEAGETVRAVAADPRMPCYATVFRWTHVIEEFGAAYRALRMRLCADAVWLDGQRAEAKAWMYAHRRRLAGKPPRGWRSGKPSSYTPERGEAVCEMIRDGASMSEVNRTPGMPSAKVAYTWLRREPTFRALYAEACAFRAFYLRELATDLAIEGARTSFRETRKVVAAIDGRAGRMLPKKYRAP